MSNRRRRPGQPRPGPSRTDPLVLERPGPGEDQAVSTEGITFRLDGVLFTCHGRVSAFDLAEFAGRAEDAAPEINGSRRGRILADFMHGLPGDPTYAEVTRHRLVHQTPDSVMQQIIFDLIEDSVDRLYPGRRPRRSAAGPASPPPAPPSPVRRRARSGACRAGGQGGAG